MEQEDMEKRLGKLEDRVNIIDKNGAVMEVLVKNGQEIQDQFSGALDKFSTVISNVEKTLIGLQNEIKLTRDDVGTLKKTVEIIEDKGKIDWMLLIKENLGKLISGFILGGGVIAGIFVLLVKVIQ
jgi:hypothetical protein